MEQKNKKRNTLGEREKKVRLVGSSIFRQIDSGFAQPFNDFGFCSHLGTSEKLESVGHSLNILNRCMGSGTTPNNFGEVNI